MAKRTLYLECNTGISGDMTAAALLDLGGDRAELERVLSALPVSGFRTEISRVSRGGIDCCDFSVILDAEHENHDHDMEYLYGHRNHEHHEHSHTHEEHAHHHSHDTHSHEHRNLADVVNIISSTEMTKGAETLAIRIFTILAEAEAKAHGTTVDQVHFHEVGAVDSIVDVIAAAVLFDSLRIDEVVIPSVSEGTGTVRCRHGILPVPVPAVLNIVQSCALTLNIQQDRAGELVTPTGAAFAGAVKTADALPKRFRILKTGLGAGKRAYEVPSILRAMLIEDVEDDGDDEPEDRIVKLEANIDDCTGEQMGYAMQKLFEAGARDVSFLPCYMKKNRPGYILNVICMPSDAETMENIIFRCTTTIGIRRLILERTVLPRVMRTVSTKFGPAKIKEITVGNEKKYYPEYRDVVTIAEKADLTFDEARRLILGQCRFL